MNNFDTELKERTAYVEKIVYDYRPKEEGLQKIIIEAMNYSLKAGGKRLRPMLVLETLRLFGGDEKRGISVYGSNGNDSYIFIST